MAENSEMHTETGAKDKSKDKSTGKPEDESKDKVKESLLASLSPIIVMGMLIVVIQLLSLAFAAPMGEADMRAFEDPEAVSNSIYYIVLILVFTGFLLFVIKHNHKWVVNVFIQLAVLSTIYYVAYAMVPNTAIALVPALALTIAINKYPEWYVIDIVGVIIGVGASTIFGISLAVIPTLVLLILLAVYDMIAVYKTKHMIKLAEGVMELKAPILFVVPKKWSYSFLKEKFDPDAERDAYFMGLGDAVMPTILVVSANVFIEGAASVAIPFIGMVNLPALGGIVGTAVGFVLLMYVVQGGKPQAGLPFLNGGVIAGYLVGCAIAGVPFI